MSVDTLISTILRFTKKKGTVLFSTSHTSLWTCEKEIIVSHNLGTLGEECAYVQMVSEQTYFSQTIVAPLRTYLTGKEPCPPWTRRRSGYGRSSSCSCGWPWYRRTVRKPPWWVARWHSPVNRPQTLSCTPGGDHAWQEVAGLFKRCAAESKTGFGGVCKSYVDDQLSSEDSHVPQPAKKTPSLPNELLYSDWGSGNNAQQLFVKWQKSTGFDEMLLLMVLAELRCTLNFLSFVFT